MGKNRNLEHGVVVGNRRANHFVPIVRGWAKAHMRFARWEDGKDGAYWYSERTNVSMLAASTWMQRGHIALEEFAEDKGWGGDKRPGRVDLLVSGPKLDATIEAKQRWMHAELAPQALKSRIRKSFEAAREDVRETYGAKSRYACVFFVLLFPEDKFPSYENNTDGVIRAELERYLDSDKADLWAWCFPRQTRELYFKRERCFYPGVILGLRRLPERRKSK